jgi:acyl-CoA synthetase (AMP-forming)/AMP-acid ligase II
MTPELDDALAQPFVALADLVALHAAHRPGHAALIHDERSLSFAELDRRVDRIAAALQRDSVGIGDTVAIAAFELRSSTRPLLLGALRTRAAAAPIPQSTARRRSRDGRRFRRAPPCSSTAPSDARSAPCARASRLT